MFVGLGASTNNVLLIEENNLISLEGADVYISFSDMESLTDDMLESMAKKPVIITMDPCKKMNSAQSLRKDAIISTCGKVLHSQIFPYMAKAVLKSESSQVNLSMKLAAAKTLDEIHINGDFDNMRKITNAIIKAAKDSGVAKNANWFLLEKFIIEIYLKFF